MTISVVIPVRSSAAWLTRCLAAVRSSFEQPFECIVVDDCSADGSAAAARAAGASVLRTPVPAGPAAARNLGAAAASGDLLLFLDADVCVRPGTLTLIRNRFESDPTIDAVIGSYDSEPADPGLASQYKNLLHHFVHQNGRPEAETFWSACGACRREVFLAAGGFDESYRRPCIEDVELGYRLRLSGRRIVLDPAIQVKHLKRYRYAGVLRSDIFDRALPWTRLIMRTGRIPNDLNLSLSQRACAILVSLAVFAPLALPAGYAAALVLALPPVLVVGLNWRFFGFLLRRRGWALAACGVLFQVFYYLYCAGAFAAGASAYLLGLFRGELRAPAAAASSTPRSGAANGTREAR